MSYRVRIYADPEGNGDSFQIFGNNECPPEFIAWVKEHLNCDLNESNDHCFGGSEDNYMPLPVDDIHSLLECVNAYVSNFIKRNINNPFPHNAFPDMNHLWAKDYAACPAFELPTAQLAATVAASTVFCTFDLQEWLHEHDIIELDYKTKRWKYAPGKKVWIAGW